MRFRKLEPSTELARYRLELRQRVEALKAETAAREKQAQVAALAGEPASADIRPADIHPATAPRGTRAIAISTRLMGCVGDPAAGLMLSQLVYWSRRHGAGDDAQAREGWIWKTAQEWSRELGGMSWKVQRRARQHLLGLGLIEERRRSMPARLEFRLVVPAMLERLDRGDLAIDASNWRDRQAAEALFGRGFVYHAALAATFPLATAMLCSRLLAGQRWPISASAQDGSSEAGHVTRYTSLSRQSWYSETGLSRDQWQTARRHLRQAGVLIERQRNYPRRVDLALDLQALHRRLHAGEPAAAPNLAQETHSEPTCSAFPRAQQPELPEPSSRQDRAIQPGDNESLPNPPRQSPDPACKNRPFPIASIARSHLQYLQVTAIQLPLQLPPRPLLLRTSSAQAVPAFGWGGSGGVYQQAKQPGTGSGQHAAVDGLATVNTQLTWPGCFTDGDQGRARVQLQGLPEADQQTILDEIAWMAASGKQIRSPVALLRTLVTRHGTGQFEPDGAHRIAEKRERDVASRRTPAANPSPERTTKRTTERYQRSPEVMQRIHRLLGRVGAP